MLLNLSYYIGLKATLAWLDQNTIYFKILSGNMNESFEINLTSCEYQLN